MDNDNILSENLLKKIRDKLANKLAIRQMKKDPQVKKNVKKLNKEIEELWDEINDFEKQFNPKAKPFKPKKLTIDDLVKQDKTVANEETQDQINLNEILNELLDDQNKKKKYGNSTIQDRVGLMQQAAAAEDYIASIQLVQNDLKRKYNDLI